MIRTRFSMPRALGAAGLALALAACAGEEDETTYEVDAEDLSGGELQVREPDPGAPEVDVPEVEMTNVPPEEADAAMDEETGG